MSRLLGKKQDQKAGGVSAFCLYASFATGLLFMILLLLFQAPVLKLLGANSDSYVYASDYYTWIAIGTPFIIFSMIPNNQLRAEGLASFGMWGAIAGSVANIILDPLLIFGLHMGAAGAALATTLSNFLSCMLYVVIIRKKCRIMTLSFGQSRISGSYIGEILRIGIPASVTNIMFSLSMLAGNRALEPFGNESIAAMGIAMKINMVSSMTLVGFAFGGLPLLGYCYGAGNRPRFLQTLRFAYLLEAGLGLCFAVSLFFSAPGLLRFFISDHQVVDIGIRILRFMQISSLLAGISLVTICTCQAAGHALGTLTISLCRQGIIYFIMLTVLRLWIGFDGILLAQPASDLITGILSLCIVYGIVKKWKPIRPASS